MVDSRSNSKFARIKANRDQPTLNLKIYQTFPTQLRQKKTQISAWAVSVHKIKNLFLFATADDLQVSRDTSYGKQKRDG
jgi:hypothetical protein